MRLLARQLTAELIAEQYTRRTCTSLPCCEFDRNSSNETDCLRWQAPSPRQRIAGSGSGLSPFGSSLSPAGGGDGSGWPDGVPRSLSPAIAIGRYDGGAAPDALISASAQLGGGLRHGGPQPADAAGWQGTVTSGKAPNSVRSSSLSPARPLGGGGGAPSSEGIPPRPPSKLGLSDFAAGSPHSPGRLAALAGSSVAAHGAIIERRAGLQSPPPQEGGASAVNRCVAQNIIKDAYGGGGGDPGQQDTGRDGGTYLAGGGGNSAGTSGGLYPIGSAGNGGLYPIDSVDNGGLYPTGSAAGPGTPPSLQHSQLAHREDSLSPLSSEALSTAGDARP